MDRMPNDWMNDLPPVEIHVRSARQLTRRSAKLPALSLNSPKAISPSRFWSFLRSPDGKGLRIETKSLLMSVSVHTVLLIALAFLVSPSRMTRSAQSLFGAFNTDLESMNLVEFEMVQVRLENQLALAESQAFDRNSLDLTLSKPSFELLPTESKPKRDDRNNAFDASNAQGGWRYEYQGDSDTSVTGWCLMALMSARSASIEIPEATLRRVGAFLNSVDSANGSRYSYKPNMPPTPAMTAEGLLCRMYLGWPRDSKALNLGIKELSANYLFRGPDRSYYYWYYATQVMHHAGGKDWETWNEAMKPQLLTMQIKEGNETGSWDPADAMFDRVAGRLYATCMVLYCLEVYYRHMPIYESPWYRSGDN